MSPGNKMAELSGSMTWMSCRASMRLALVSTLSSLPLTCTSLSTSKEMIGSSCVEAKVSYAMFSRSRMARISSGAA